MTESKAKREKLITAEIYAREISIALSDKAKVILGKAARELTNADENPDILVYTSARAVAEQLRADHIPLDEVKRLDLVRLIADKRNALNAEPSFAARATQGASR